MEPSVYWSHPSSRDTNWLATMADETILGGGKMTTAVASVARLLGVGELVESSDGELAELC